MKIKIDLSAKSKAALTAALSRANGKATAHTFINCEEIIQASACIEAELHRLGLKKDSRSGAIATASSGGSVANAYKYTRITSTVTMVRGSSAWFLVAVSASETYRRTAGDTYISLTAAQDAEVTAKFRTQYSKQPTATVKVEVAS